MRKLSIFNIHFFFLTLNFKKLLKKIKTILCSVCFRSFYTEKIITICLNELKFLFKKVLFDF